MAIFSLGNFVMGFSISALSVVMGVPAVFPIPGGGGGFEYKFLVAILASTAGLLLDWRVNWSEVTY